MRRTIRLSVFLLVIGLALLSQGFAAFADKRVALIVGNSKYEHTPHLDNPVNDANDVAQALTAIGFQVTLKLDPSKREMDQSIAQFARDATGADAAMFYYSGHGMQFQGQNYVMPVDAELRDEISLRYEMVGVDDVKLALERANGVKIMILDACRNNPLATQLARSISTSTRGISNVQGYARPEKTQGMIIVYATQANEVAFDGGGRNSPFSAAFLKEVREPGLEIGTMFRRIGAEVYESTKGQQSPELSISLVPEYYLNRSDTDQTVWARIRASADSDAIRKFLTKYPDSFYAPDAKARLELLDRQVGEASARQDVSKLQDARNMDIARLTAEQSEKDRIAREARDREQELAAKLAAADAERQKLTAELAERADKEKLAKEAREHEQELAAKLAAADAERQKLAAQLAAREAERAEADQRKASADIKVAEAKAEVPPAIEAAPDRSALLPPIQAELRRLGCFGAVGDWTSGEMRKALANYARHANLAAPPDAPSAELLESLKQKHDRVCPSECSAREVELNGKCVAKTCGPHEYLNKAGACVEAPRVVEAPRPRPPVVRKATPEPAASAPSGNRSHCFSFNGSQYCE